MDSFFKGEVIDYTAVLNDEPESASIILPIGKTLLELFENKIVSIKEMKEKVVRGDTGRL